MTHRPKNLCKYDNQMDRSWSQALGMKGCEIAPNLIESKHRK